ncbi:MAG: CoA transferase, partial [Thaumarchaeota archaeon]|nr:CoA transferase [Nitrososphaerota archaeon]
MPEEITLNLAASRGQNLFKRLVKVSDIIIENNLPGTMEKFKCDYDTLKEINEGIIFASISGYGQNGPYRLRPGFNTNAQAMGGLMSMTGFPDGPPTVAGNHIADYLGAFFTVYGTLIALYERTRTGKGQYIDVALMDAVAFTGGDVMLKYLETGEIKSRSGNRIGHINDAYQANDGYVIVNSPGPIWPKVAKTIGREDLSDLRPLISTSGEDDEGVEEARKALTSWVAARSVA